MAGSIDRAAGCLSDDRSAATVDEDDRVSLCAIRCSGERGGHSELQATPRDAAAVEREDLIDWEKAGPKGRAAWAARAMVAQQILSMKLTGFRSAPYDAAENGERL